MKPPLQKGFYELDKRNVLLRFITTPQIPSLVSLPALREQAGREKGEVNIFAKSKNLAT